MRRFYTRRNIIIGLTISIVFVSFFMWYSYSTIKKVQLERKSVNASLQSLEVLRGLLDDIRDIETSQRGYLISGNKEYLDRYNSATIELSKDTTALKKLGELYPHRIEYFQQLLKQIRQKKEFAELTLSVHATHGTDSSSRIIQSGSGKIVMDSIRNIISLFEEEDKQLLNQSDKQRAIAARETVRLFIILAVSFVICLTIIFWWINRGLIQRGRYEQKIAYLAGLTEKTSDAIISVDTQRIIKSWNSGAMEMYGYSAEEAIGKNISTLLNIRSAKEELESKLEELKVSGYYKGEYEAKQKSGEPVIAEVSISVMKNTKNKIEGYVAVHRDITESEKAEKLLQRFNEELKKQVEKKTAEINHSNERFEMISRTTNDAIWEWNLETGEIWGNEIHQQLYGLTLADPVPDEKEWQQRLHPDDREGLIKKQADILASDENIFITEYRFQTYDRGFRNIYDRCYIVRNEDGKAIRMLGNMMDITERKKAEFDLKESEIRYRTLFEQSPAGIYRATLNGKIIACNDSFAAMLGYSSFDELPEKDSSWFYFSKAERDPSIAMLQEKGKLISKEIMLKHKDGSPVYLIENCFLRKDSIMGEDIIEGMMIDITDRKKAVVALSKSEEKYRTLIEQASDGIIVYSLDGRIYDFNQSASVLAGYEKEEFKKITLYDLLDNEELIVNPDNVERFKKGEPVLFERRIRKKDGSVADAELNVRMLGDGKILAFVRDISDRRKTEEAIMKTNARFQILSKATSDIVWDWDMLEGTIWWNDNYFSLLGIGKINEMSPIESWYDRIHPDDLNRIKRDVEVGIRDNLIFWNHEYRFAKSDGTYLNFLDRCFVIRNKEGNPVRMIGSMINMTPVYETQKKVAESENRLRTIINSEPQCIKLLDKNGLLLDMNPAGLGMIEADSLEQIKGHSVLDIIDAEYRKDFRQLTKNVFEDKPGFMQFGITGLKGTKRWLETHAVPMKDAEGRITELLGVTIDITGKRKAEEELRKNEEKYRTLVEQAIDAIALYDINGKLLDVNTGSVNLLGYSKEELMQMSLHDILTKEEITIKPIQYEVLQEGKSTVKQRKMRRKDNSIVETEVRSQQLPDGRFLSVIRDLTERKKVEKELNESYKAIRKLTRYLQNIREEERTHIAREIHDELGQQLTVLKMDISWLNKKINSSDDSIKSKMNGLLSMLDDTVKSVRRISSELRPSLLDDLGLTAAMEWQLAEFEKRSGIHTGFINSENEAELPESVKTALFRIFQESLTNVARHSTAKNVTVSFIQNHKDFVLSIADDGKGFDKQKIADKRTLGILGMKERTSMIDGTYEIVSEPGKGTVVTVKIPFTKN